MFKGQIQGLSLYKPQEKKTLRKTSSYDWKRSQSSLPWLKYEIQDTNPNTSLLEIFFFTGKCTALKSSVDRPYLTPAHP